jgi:hypothetical protein
MICPNCNNESFCGCSNCAERNKGKVLWDWPDPNTMACGHCGHSGSADYWMEVEVAALLRETGATTLTEAGRITRQRLEEARAAQGRVNDEVPK